MKIKQVVFHAISPVDCREEYENWKTKNGYDIPTNHPYFHEFDKIWGRGTWDIKRGDHPTEHMTGFELLIIYSLEY